GPRRSARGIGGTGRWARDRAGDRLAVVQRARPGALLLASGLGWPRRADGGVLGPAPRLTRGVRRLDSGPVSGRSSARAFFCHALRQSRRAVSGPPGSLGTRAR